MKTIEIPKVAWTTFLRDLVRMADGRSIRLEVEGLELGDQEMADLAPLHDIEFELKGSAADSIEITAGGRQEELSHLIERPQRMYARVNDLQQIECLYIEDADNGKTFLFFEELPLLPDRTEADRDQASAP